MIAAPTPRDRGIIMTGESVRAILAGRKVQHRMALKLPTKGMYEHPQMGGWAPTTHGGGGCFRFARDGSKVPVPETVAIWHQTRGNCIEIPWQVGDRSWVRETWQLHARASDVCTIVYRASIDGGWTAAHAQFLDALAVGMQPKPFQVGWRSPLHMPRWASRLTLAITDVRVQRLQDISEDDARAEGHPMTWDGKCYDAPPPEIDSWQGYGRASFALTWSKIHGSDTWVKNPWVAAITFEPSLPIAATARREHEVAKL